MNKSSLSQFLKRVKNKITYFGDKSSLHGVAYVMTRANVPTSRRIFWSFILICCCVGAGAILQASMKLYANSAVAYTVETNYLDWDTPFPAVTVCETLDNDRIDKFIVKNTIPKGLTSFYKDVAFWNVKFCKSCGSCIINKTCVEDFQAFIDNYRMKCSELLTRCWWNDKPFACCDRYRPVQTEYGICFTYNSLLEGNGSIFTVNNKVGLPKLIFHVSQAISLRVHAPDDRLSVALGNIFSQYSVLTVGTDVDAYLKAEQTLSDVSIKAMSKELRDCLYKHERPAFAHLWPFPEYTNSACLMYCRAIAQAYTCNCTHHFLPKLAHTPSCDLQGLACLYKNKELMKTVNDCGCPMACEELQYKLVHVFHQRQTKSSQEEFGKITKVGIQIIQLPALRVKRREIRELLGLVVDFGGVVGVFFGASLCSVIEIFYLLCIRR